MHGTEVRPKKEETKVIIISGKIIAYIGKQRYSEK